MPNFGYHLARAEGALVRAAYAATLPILAPRGRRNPALFPFEVYSYSGEATLPEQVASIRSFLRQVGRPDRFTIVSDGTHSARSAALLRSLDPSIVFSPASAWVPDHLPARFRAYLSQHPTGKQLALIMSLPREGPALYLDSDILFFPGAHALAAELEAPNSPASYLADCRFSGDERILRAPAERTDPVNTGLLFLREKLDWSLSIARFMELEGEPIFFTNQTATHLAMHANGARPLDSKKFILQLDDQFLYRDRYAGPEIMLRHYVNPVRHKFWSALVR